MSEWPAWCERLAGLGLEASHFVGDWRHAFSPILFLLRVPTKVFAFFLFGFLRSDFGSLGLYLLHPPFDASCSHDSVL